MKYLSLLVFTTGAVILGVELSAARLLDPWFGNSQIVWAGLIGLMLFYLALGAWLGGKLSDRFPSLGALLILTSIAGLGVALIPLVSPPILRIAAVGLESFVPGLLAGTLLAVLLLFSLPIILLGAVSPWAVRLAVTDLRRTGATAGRLYAIATSGSILGTFLPVLWLIPAYGTRWSFYLLAMGLLVVVGIGALFASTDRRLVGVPAIALLVVIVMAFFSAPGSVRAHWDNDAPGQLLYEDESLYNYIAVRQWGSEHHLKLNEGVGIHSVYHPDSLLSHGIWDYFLLAPFFRTQPPPPTMDDEVLVIGLAAGTVPGLYTEIYGPLPITGVELDPQIIEVGQRYFEMNQPNLEAIAADGRRWLHQQPPEQRFAFIFVDAYRPPYIPFHLTTVEFFQLVYDHLDEQGVMAINVGRTDRNYELVDALAATLAEVFPAVFVIDEPGPAHELANSLVVATVEPIDPALILHNAGKLPDSFPLEFRQFVAESVTRTRLVAPTPGALVFTDDHAPVEQVVHGIIWDFVTTP
jgi:predicted membrane-bound spermidine synthase